MLPSSAVSVSGCVAKNSDLVGVFPTTSKGEDLEEEEEGGTGGELGRGKGMPLSEMTWMAGPFLGSLKRSREGERAPLPASSSLFLLESGVEGGYAGGCLSLLGGGLALGITPPLSLKVVRMVASLGIAWLPTTTLLLKVK